MLGSALSLLKLQHVAEANMHHVIRSSGDAERGLNSTRCTGDMHHAIENNLLKIMPGGVEEDCPGMGDSAGL
jgi:hypothetical protein